MKIAMIGQKGIPCQGGGIERHVEELSLALTREGHGVFVYTRPYYTPKELKSYKKINLISLPSLHTKHLDAASHTLLSTLDALVRNFDIIHYHGIGPALFSFLPRILKPRTKVIGTFHSSDWQHQKWNFFAQKMLKLGAWMICHFPHRTIVISKTLQKYCLDKYKRKTDYISSGVSKKEEPKTQNLELIKKFGLEKDKYILVVSRLVRHKGIHYLIEAFKQLKAKAKDKERDNNSCVSLESLLRDFKLVIVGGTAFTDDYVSYLRRLSEKRQDIIFTGYQFGETLATIFRNAYLYVHPSCSEGKSLSVLEAMSYKKAVLISDIEENLEILEEAGSIGKVGFVFAKRNIQDLTAKLFTLICNPQIVKEVADQALKHVLIHYNWNEIARKVEEVYKKTTLIKDQLKKKELVLSPE